MNQPTLDPNADDTEMRERRAARERFEMDLLEDLVDYANSPENKRIPHQSSWCIQEFHNLCGDVKCKCECHMKKPSTPFEKFQALAKTVVRVPKKDVVKLEKKWKAARKTKKKKPKK